MDDETGEQLALDDMPPAPPPERERAPVEVFPPMSPDELLTLTRAARLLKMDQRRARPLFAPGGPLHHCLFDPYGQYPHVVRISSRRLTRTIAEGNK